MQLFCCALQAGMPACGIFYHNGNVFAREKSASTVTTYFFLIIKLRYGTARATIRYNQ
jgi:hypothetical protein